MQIKKYLMNCQLKQNCNGIEEEAHEDFGIFNEFYFLCGCFLAPVTSRRAWLELLRIEDDLGTCALRFFKKSNPVFKHSGGGISLYNVSILPHTHTHTQERDNDIKSNQRVVIEFVRTTKMIITLSSFAFSFSGGLCWPPLLQNPNCFSVCKREKLSILSPFFFKHKEKGYRVYITSPAVQESQ